MGNIIFYYENYWDKTSNDTVPALTETTQHENFIAENTQNSNFNKAWRSQYGAGSGWGYFTIKANTNDRLDFEDSGSTVRAASLTPGNYVAANLASHIETQMEAVTTDAFTVEYLESSNKFKITNDTGTFELLWNTGTNKSRSIADTIGFDDAADDTGADNYTADDMRIHSDEGIVADLETATSIYAAIIRGHNLQGPAYGVLRADFSSDNFATIGSANSFDYISGTDWGDPTIVIFSTPKTYRYVRIYIEDIDNPDTYVKVGRISFAGRFQPVENFLNEGDIVRIDPSIIVTSEAGQESSFQYDTYDTWTYVFRVHGAAEKLNFDTMFDAVGTSKNLFICEDPDNLYPATKTKYVRFTGWKWTPIRRDTDLWYVSIGVKEAR